MEQAGILLFNIEEKKRNRISDLCSENGIKTKWVQPEEYLLPLERVSNFGEDIGGKNTDTEKNTEQNVYSGINVHKEVEKFPGEMFVMVDFSKELLDQFLTEYRMKQIEPVLLKAVLTKHNKTWNSIMLYKELMRERLELLQMNKK
ncbi:MAG: DUF3783 domain-containing protein [Anaerocolumna sp.]